MVTEPTNRRMKNIFPSCTVYASIRIFGRCRKMHNVYSIKTPGRKISHTEQRLSVMGHGYKWTTDNGCNGYNDTIKHKIMYERAYQLHLDEAVPLHAMFG